MPQVRVDRHLVPGDRYQLPARGLHQFDGGEQCRGVSDDGGEYLVRGHDRDVAGTQHDDRYLAAQQLVGGDHRAVRVEQPADRPPELSLQHAESFRRREGYGSPKTLRTTSTTVAGL